MGNTLISLIYTLCTGYRELWILSWNDLQCKFYIEGAGRRPGGRELNGHGSDDEYDTNDSGSVISTQSDALSQDGGMLCMIIFLLKK